MDFSTLSDEQLIELIKGALAETIKRGQTVVDAAREVMLDEKREAEIRFKAQEIAKEKILRQEAERIAKEEEAKIQAINKPIKKLPNIFTSQVANGNAVEVIYQATI